MSLKKIVVALLLGYVGFMFIIKFTPTIEQDVSSANITNTLTSGMVDMGAWLLPVGAIVGIFYGIFKLFGGGGSATAGGD